MGKGIIAASLAKLLQSRGYKVTIQKFDPYINVDPGTLNPYEHGECFVTDDGAETDLDLGHYERFLNVPTSQANNVTTGRVYLSVIEKERRGEFLGKTVQVVPHITDEIKRNILALGETGKFDIVITEIGGCVGDIESLPFIEATRQLKWELGENNSMVIHLTLLPYLAASGELKTKPTQHSVKELLGLGIQPEMLICRVEQVDLPQGLRNKIAHFCNVPVSSVIAAPDVKNIYELPIVLHAQKLDKQLCERLNIWTREPDLSAWKRISEAVVAPEHGRVSIAVVGKYVHLRDSYKSLHESLVHGGIANDVKVDLTYIDSEELESGDLAARLSQHHGLLVPGGFGDRGTEGKIRAIQYARENGVPFFGICLGMQMAVVEYARNVSGLTGANSAEFNPDAQYLVVDIMPDQRGVKDKGATMRLGAYPCTLAPGSIAASIYGSEEITERHRHRYEVNNQHREKLLADGLVLSGLSPDKHLVEMVELPNHPYFVGCQFHPEFKSKPLKPHPLFTRFVGAAVKQRDTHEGPRTSSSSSASVQA